MHDHHESRRSPTFDDRTSLTKENMVHECYLSLTINDQSSANSFHNRFSYNFVEPPTIDCWLTLVWRVMTRRCWCGMTHHPEVSSWLMWQDTSSWGIILVDVAWHMDADMAWYVDDDIIILFSLIDCRPLLLEDFKHSAKFVDAQSSTINDWRFHFEKWKILSNCTNPWSLAIGNWQLKIPLGCMKHSLDSLDPRPSL